MFLFMILVTLCSHPIILTNMICLGELVTYITGLSVVIDCGQTHQTCVVNEMGQSVVD